MEKIDIYTDGSQLDKQNNGRLGCGGVMIQSGKLVDEFSVEIKPEWLRENYGTDKVSNPSAEMLGLLMALRNFELDGNRSIRIGRLYGNYICPYPRPENHLAELSEDNG
jgi:ribonuclease HI